MTRLPLAPAEVRAPRVASLDGLAPGFARKLAALCEAIRADGHRPLVFETLRTDARQKYLHGYGRTWNDGRGIVTNSSSADTTWHGYGLAADVVCADHLHRASDGFWRSFGVHSARVGLEWGGNWASFPDRPHVQWAPMRRSPSTIATALYRQGKAREVWQIVGADT